MQSLIHHARFCSTVANGFRAMRLRVPKTLAAGMFRRARSLSAQRIQRKRSSVMPRSADQASAFELGADNGGPDGHGLHFAKRDVTRQILQPAVRGNDNALRRDVG